jgi:hypothetical protein
MATTAQRGLLTSLYGFDPVQRRAEQQAGLDRFLAAQQTPQARMGAALGSLFGQYLAPESEEQTRVGKVNTIYNQVMADADPTKPTEYLERLGRLAQSFQQAGLPEQAEITIDRIRKLTPEPKRTVVAPGATVLNEKNEVVYTAPDREKNIKPSADFAQAAVELGFGARANLDDYNLNEARAINNLIEARRIKTAAAGAAQTPTEKAVLPGKATQLGKVEESALQGAKTIQTADAIDRVLNTSFTGFGSDAKLRVGQIAEAFGVTVTGTSETEQLKQLLAQLAQGQARSLPGALSEKELAFLREAIGTGNFTVNTLRNVTKRLRTDALAADIENQAAQKYVSDGGDLNKFNFVQNRKTAIEQATRQINEREAKQRRIEELRKKQGGR